jgi:hypothetical protein
VGGQRGLSKGGQGVVPLNKGRGVVRGIKGEGGLLNEVNMFYSVWVKDLRRRVIAAHPMVE